MIKHALVEALVLLALLALAYWAGYLHGTRSAAVERPTVAQRPAIGMPIEGQATVIDGRLQWAYAVD